METLRDRGEKCMNKSNEKFKYKKDICESKLLYLLFYKRGIVIVYAFLLHISL